MSVRVAKQRRKLLNYYIMTTQNAVTVRFKLTNARLSDEKPARTQHVKP